MGELFGGTLDGLASILLNVPPKSEPINGLKGRAEFGRSLNGLYP